MSHTSRDWRESALCAQADPEAWFPAAGGPTAAARRICAACPVKAACTADAIKTGEQHGIRGGRSARALLRSAASAA